VHHGKFWLCDRLGLASSEDLLKRAELPVLLDDSELVVSVVFFVVMMCFM
jgi:hypothetical protein